MKHKELSVKGSWTPFFIVFLQGFIDGKITKKARVNPESGLLESAYVSKLHFHCNEAFRHCAMELENEINSVRVESATLLTECKLISLRNSQAADADSDSVHSPRSAALITQKISESDGEEAAEVSGASEVHSRTPYERKKLPTTADEARNARMEAKEAARRADTRARAEEARTRARARAEEELAKAKEVHEQAEKKHDESMIRLTQIRERMISKELLAEERLAATSEAIRARLCAYAHGAVRGAVSDSHIPEIAYDCWLDEYRQAHDELDCRIYEALQQISC